METALTTVESNPKERLIISPGNSQKDLGDMLPYLAHALTESSMKMYERDIKAFTAHAKEHGLSVAEPATLESFRDYMIFQTTKSPNTINRMLAAVKRVAKEAARHNMLNRDVAYDFANIEGASMNRLKNRMKHSKSIPLSKAQMHLLCNVPDTSMLLGMRDKALLYTLATSGVRASELAGLRVDRIFHVDGGYIIQVMGKRDSEYRDANLSPEAYQLIAQWLTMRGIVSELIFTAFNDYGVTPTTRRMTARDIWNVVKQHAKQVGMEYLSPHSFRRFVATELVKTNGIRVAQISLGHASIATTQMYDTSKLTVGVTDRLL